MEAKENKGIAPETWEQMSGLVADLMQRNASLAAEVAKYRDGWAMEAMQQAKQNAKRWLIAWAITFIAGIATNATWLYVWQSYEFVSQDGTGLNSINTGSQGDLINGTESETEKEWQEPRN